MYIRKKKDNIITKGIDQVNRAMTRNNVIDLAELLGNRKELLKRNLISGISKGIGIGIGVTIITAIIIWLLQNLIKLNIPVIGEYIADIVEIVQTK